jgi:hypothetical protein
LEFGLDGFRYGERALQSLKSLVVSAELEQQKTERGLGLQRVRGKLDGGLRLDERLIKLAGLFFEVRLSRVV